MDALQTEGILIKQGPLQNASSRTWPQRIVFHFTGHSIQLMPAGSAAPASAICYLDAGLVFVGSRMGDSQFVRLHATPINAATMSELSMQATGCTYREGRNSQDVNGLYWFAKPECVVF